MPPAEQPHGAPRGERTPPWRQQPPGESGSVPRGRVQVGGGGGGALPAVQPRREPGFQRKSATPGAQRTSRLTDQPTRGPHPEAPRLFRSLQSSPESRQASERRAGGRAHHLRALRPSAALPPSGGRTSRRAGGLPRTGRRCSAQLHPPHASAQPTPGAVHTAAPGRRGLPQGPDSQTQTGTHGHAAPSTWALGGHSLNFPRVQW